MDRVFDYVMDIAGSLLKTMPHQCSSQVQQKLLPVYMKTLQNIHQKSKSYPPMLDSLCLLCDCLEFGSDELFSQISGQATFKLLQVIEELGQNEHNFVQTCIFALGCTVLRTPTGQFNELTKTINIAINIIQNP
jgi:hypothetical protein